MIPCSGCPPWPPDPPRTRPRTGNPTPPPGARPRLPGSPYRACCKEGTPQTGAISSFSNPSRDAYLVLIAGVGPLATPALAQAVLAQTEPAPVQLQPEKPDHPRPRAGDPTTTPAPVPPLSPETKALRSKLDAFKLDLD